MSRSTTRRRIAHIVVRVIGGRKAMRAAPVRAGLALMAYNRIMRAEHRREIAHFQRVVSELTRSGT